MPLTSTKQTYLTFELLLGTQTATGYPVTVVDAPAGDTEGICTLRIDKELQEALRALGSGNTDAAFLSEFGAFLFNELFTGSVANFYRTSLGIARSQQKGLHIRLRLMAPEVAALPWEYLYDPQEDAFLATSPETALVRYVPISLPVRPTIISPPLRVMVVIANPRDIQPLNVAREKAIIQEALAEWVTQGQVQLEILERAVAAEITQALRRFQPHVFHFIGHGIFDESMAYVVLEDEQSNANPIDERTFREFFSSSQETRLAVLNACQSATLSSSQPLVGLAPRLLQRQLSAVVAMQHPISDKAALVFTREFYRSLALGFPIDAAISEARKGVFLEIGAGSSAWGTPVLFLRAKDGRLFQVEEITTRSLEIPPPSEPPRLPEMPSFVGREAELTYFAEKLEMTHLAVIAGMAGVGKTASLKRYMQAIEEALRLIEERESEYVKQSVIPLDWIRNKRRLQVKLDRLKAQLEQLIPKPQTSEDELPPYLLIYMADRDKQEYEIGEILEKLDYQPTKPIVCVIYGNHEQCHDMFLERLIHISLPKLLELAPGIKVTSKPLNWPSSLDNLDKLQARLEKNLIDTLSSLCGKKRAAIDDIRKTVVHYPGPLMLHTLLDYTTWRQYGINAIVSYLQFWEKWPSIPEKGLFICLYIKYHQVTKVVQKHNFIQKLFAKHTHVIDIEAEIDTQIRNCDFTKFENLICRALTKLDNIEKLEVENWARLEHTKNYCYRRGLDPSRKIQEMYDDWYTETGSLTIPMEMLVRHLQRFLIELDRIMEDIV